MFALLVIVFGAWYWFAYGRQSANQADLGTYAYECDEHVSFTMTPASDLSSISIKPIGGSYPPVSILKRQVTNSGARFESENLVLVGHGESIILGEGDDALNCSPVEDSQNAPFNFGD